MDDLEREDRLSISSDSSSDNHQKNHNVALKVVNKTDSLYKFGKCENFETFGIDFYIPKSLNSDMLVLRST